MTSDQNVDVQLGVWIAAEKERLDTFAAWWFAGTQGDQPNAFPYTLPEGEWDEQYRTWVDF